MEPTVREATRADLPALVRSLGRRDFFAELLDRQEAGKGRLLVAWLSGVPVGHVYLRLERADELELQERLPKTPLLQHLEVRPGHRNRRIGSALIKAAEQHLEKLDHQRVALAVALDNHGAARLYRRHGYREWSHPPITTSYQEVHQDGSTGHREELCQILVKNLGQR